MHCRCDRLFLLGDFIGPSRVAGSLAEVASWQGWSLAGTPSTKQEDTNRAGNGRPILKESKWSAKKWQAALTLMATAWLSKPRVCRGGMGVTIKLQSASAILMIPSMTTSRPLRGPHPRKALVRDTSQLHRPTAMPIVSCCSAPRTPTGYSEDLQCVCYHHLRSRA